MPQKEEYGAQPPLEFLRQFISNDGFYDVSRYSWKVCERELLEPSSRVPGIVIMAALRVLSPFSQLCSFVLLRGIIAILMHRN